MTEKAPEIDQDGKMINPHNPEFITKVPWYLGNHGPTLKHHNIQKNDHFLSLTESDQLIEKKIQAQRTTQANASKTVYRKGACKNCGAMTHNEKDCMERPRSTKRSAWKSGVDIAADDVVLNLETHGKVSYAAKRDQWKGYDPTEYKEIMDRHERLQQEREAAKQKEKEDALLHKQQQSAAKKVAKKAVKAPKGDTGEGSDLSGGSDTDSDYGSDEDTDEDGNGRAGNDEQDFLEKDAAAVDFQKNFTPQGGVGGNGMRITARNLRIREDTPKYLRNLSLDSAFYDPKSRSMRANPYPNANPDEIPFAGDNFVRYSGDAVTLAQNQVLCWEMQEQGVTAIDVISNPSQAELLHKQYVEKKKTMESSKKDALLAKYTDGKALPILDPRLRLGQTEAYVEYGVDGRVKTSNMDHAVVRTKYEEDIYHQNHTSVWGSFYNRKTASWGYTCCHSCLKSSYCLGKKGIELEASTIFTRTNAPSAATMSNPVLSKPTTSTTNSTANSTATTVNPFSSKATQRTGASELFGEVSNPTAVHFDDQQMQRLKEKKNQKETNSHGNSEGKEQEGGAGGEGGEGAVKRGYHSMQSVEMTAEEMELYRMKRVKADDPMANYVDEDDLPPQ